MMVSSLQPPPRSILKKKNKHKDGMSSPSSQGKKRKEQGKSEIAALYREDIGMAGVKKAKFGGDGPILKGPEGLKFQISETEEEKLRRLRRKARFHADGGSKKQGKRTKLETLSSFGGLGKTTQQKNNEPDFLSRALSSTRKDRVTQSSMGESNDYSNRDQLVGTNQELEKPYLRLTTYPKAENVRPLEVLVKSLAHIKSKYYQEEDYEWANEQLKSVRQDITVQRIRNRFVLDVYETHARILLEHGDLAEFNQCQTMIRNLTTSGIEPGDTVVSGNTHASENGGSAEENCSSGQPMVQSEEALDEFRAYHVLYALVQNSWEDLTRALVRVREFVRENDVDGSSKTASSRHGLEVVKAVIHNDYRAFFRLYENAPHMSAYLMDFLVKRMREKAYERIIAAYRPTICIEFFRGALCFNDLEETRFFLRQMGSVFVKGEPPLWVDCKASNTR